MLTFAINENNDIFLDSNNNIALATNLTAMGNICVNKSLTRKGEVYYDTDKGIDFFNSVFGEIADTLIFQADLITQLKDTVDVIDIKNYNYSITTSNNSQIYNYSVDVQTNYGVIQLNG